MRHSDIAKIIAGCFQRCWEDHATDTGCYPPDIEASNSRTILSYQPSTWTDRSAECASHLVMDLVAEQNRSKSRLIEHLQGENEMLKKGVEDWQGIYIDTLNKAILSEEEVADQKEQIEAWQGMYIEARNEKIEDDTPRAIY